MGNIDWGSIAIFLVITAINAGIVWTRVSDLTQRVSDLEKGHKDMQNDHQKMEVTIVNVPSKDDIKDLGAKLSTLEKVIVKLEVTMDLVARQTIRQKGSRIDDPEND